MRSLIEKPGVIPLQCNRLAVSKPGAQIWRKLSFALRSRDDTLVAAAVKTDEAIVNSSGENHLVLETAYFLGSDQPFHFRESEFRYILV